MLTREIDAIADLNSSDIQQIGTIVSLEEQLLNAYSRASVETQEMTNTILQSLQKNPGTLSSSDLIRYQEALSQHYLNTSINSAVSRKAAGAVETLLRS